MTYKRTLQIILISFIAILPNLILAFFIPKKDVSLFLMYATVYGVLFNLICVFILNRLEIDVFTLSQMRFDKKWKFATYSLLRNMFENAIFVISYAVFAFLLLLIRSIEINISHLLMYAFAQYIINFNLSYALFVSQIASRKRIYTFIILFILSVMAFMAYIYLDFENLNFFSMYAVSFLDRRDNKNLYYSSYGMFCFLRASIFWLIIITIVGHIQRRVYRD